MTSISPFASPRLKRLQQALAAENATALEHFWQEIARQREPLIEPVEDNEVEVVGLLDIEPTYGAGPSLLVVNRHLRNVLQTRSFPVTYA
jgi:hypothetical protein